MAVANAADLLMPMYAGKLVDAIAMHSATRSLALRSALNAIAMMALLGGVLTLLRYAAMAGIIRLTLRLMSPLCGRSLLACPAVFLPSGTRITTQAP